MNVFTNTVVTLSFKLYDASNHLIEETDEPVAYLHGGHSGIFPKVEAALANKEVGDTVSVTLEPDDAFGDYDTNLMRLEPVDQLPADIAVGGPKPGGWHPSVNGFTTCEAPHVDSTYTVDERTAGNLLDW